MDQNVQLLWQQTFTSLLKRVSCLMRTAHARFLSDKNVQLLWQQTFTSLLNSVSCLMTTVHARFPSDTAHCPMVTSTSICRTTVPDSGSGHKPPGTWPQDWKQRRIYYTLRREGKAALSSPFTFLQVRKTFLSLETEPCVRRGRETTQRIRRERETTQRIRRGRETTQRIRRGRETTQKKFDSSVVGS